MIQILIINWRILVSEIFEEENLKMSVISTQSIVNGVVSPTRTAAHNFKLNVEEQVQRKIEHATKAILKVEINKEDIKIKPNSGNFKVISEEIKKFKIGDEIKSKDGIAVVKDKYEQTDINKIPYMSKTEFSVTDIETNSTQKAVLHTYYTQTFLMIQGKG